jgi:hypothetical protein
VSDFRNYPVVPGKHTVVDLDAYSPLNDIQAEALIAYYHDLSVSIRKDMEHRDKIGWRLLHSAEAKLDNERTRVSE